MKRNLLALIPLILLTSCAQKWGVYTITHEEQLSDGFSVRTVRHENNVRSQVLLDGRLVGELDVSDGHIKTVVSSYNKLKEGVDENMSVTYNGDHLVSVLISASEDGTVLIMDKDGDGLPDIKSEGSGEDIQIKEINYFYAEMPRKRE